MGRRFAASGKAGSWLFKVSLKAPSMSFALGLNQIAELSETRFEQRLAQILAQEDPTVESMLASDEGIATLRQQCAKAKSFGMVSELDIASYVITAWTLGPDFDTRFPAMAEILGTDRLTPAQKADALERVCTSVMAELQAGGN